MPPENWQKLNEIFQEAFCLKDEEREDFLREACPDEGLYNEVKSLLDSSETAESFLDESILSVGAKFLAGESSNRFLGTRLGAHQLISEISQGGMGTVYLAARIDDEYQQRVAIKIIRRGMDTTSLIERFRSERQFLANLNHSNIARLLDGGTTGEDLPYLVMEYVKGLPVTEFCARRNLSLTERLKLFQKICGAVSYAHEQGIIHRDLKPSNILVNENGEPKLLDFGIAKFWSETADYSKTATELRIFTPEYASPEQVRGERLNPSSDIYSLGVLLYEMLTTQKPFGFENRSPLEIAQIVCESEPEKPSTAIFRSRQTIGEDDFQYDESKVYETSRLLRGDLDNIILMAMRKEPARRYLSTDEFCEDIEKYLKNLPIKARPDSFFYRASKLISRNRATAFVSILLAVCIAAFAIYALLPQKTKIIYPSFIQPNDDAVKISNIPSTDEYLQFSANSKSVFFVNNKQIFRLNIESKNAAPLQINPASLRIAESPDGKSFAIGKTDGIYITDKNFASPRKAAGCAPGRFAWSPDNQKLAFSCKKNNQYNIFTIKTDGSDERQITSLQFASDAEWSPDGKKIIFTSGIDNDLDIYAIDADGKNQVDLTNAPSSERLPSFSPDGKHIAFISDRSGHEEIYVMNADGSDVWKLTNSNGSAIEPRWSPDGKSIAFISNRDGSDGVYLLNVEAALAAEKTFSDIDASFSPDGKHLAFASNRHGNYQIYTSDLDGKNIRQLTSGKGDSGFPRWSPDGQQIVFDSNRDGIDAIYLMNSDGANQIRLTDTHLPSRRPAWSFDGKKIVFVKFLDGNNEIFTLDLESGKENRLSENKKNDDFPVWTGDGRIVFFSDREAPRNEIYIMDADGSNVINLTNNPANDGQPTVSKAGKIVFNSNRTQKMELWMMNLDGSDPVQITNSAPDGFNSRPQFSPDGKQIVYDSNENDREVVRFLDIP